MSKKWIPGVMISQTFPNARNIIGETLEAIKIITQSGYFKAVQTLEVKDKSERKDISKYIKENNIFLTCSLARVLNENNFNLSSLDEDIRKESVHWINKMLDEMKELGANSIQLISGKAPSDINKRKAALAQLQKSLREISLHYTSGSDINVLIEPLDYYAHKKNSLGTTEEALEVIENISDTGVYICVDTSHMILNGEDVVKGTRKVIGRAPEFHFCNCITDINSEFYGDYHIPIWQNGEMTEERIGHVIEDLIEINYFSSSIKPIVFFEVSNAKLEHRPEELVKYYENKFKDYEKKFDL